MRISLIALTILFALPVTALAELQGDEVLGVWLIEQGNGYVEVTRDGDLYYGKIIGAPDGTRDPDERDENNKDPKLRDRTLNGLNLMGDYKFDGKRWARGWVYDPHTGKRYKSRLTLKDKNTLEVRGYVGTPRVGKTKIWKRVENY